MEEAKHQFADEQLQALLHKLRINTPNIKCSSGNTISRLCTNPECIQAFRCNQNLCKACGKEVHLGCISVPLQEITDLVNSRIDGCRQFAMKVFQAEEDFIKALRRSQNNFMQAYIAQKMNQNNVKCIMKIYDEKKTGTMSGRQALKICKQLQTKVSSDIKGQADKLDKYTTQLQNIYKNIDSLKQKMFITHSSEIKNELKNSQVLRLKGTVLQEDIEYIRNIFKFASFELLYRASQNNYSAEAFHQKCDNIRDTFILVRTQFGRTVGGFTHYKWNEGKNEHYFYSEEKRAFLVQLDLKQKFVPQNNSLIFCDRSEGPTFGSGHDLHIADKCNINDDSFAYFPCTYNLEGPTKYLQENQESLTTFSGAKKGGSFRVIEYQVFRVIFKS